MFGATTTSLLLVAVFATISMVAEAKMYKVDIITANYGNRSSVPYPPVAGGRVWFNLDYYGFMGFDDMGRPIMTEEMYFESAGSGIMVNDAGYFQEWVYYDDGKGNTLLFSGAGNPYANYHVRALIGGTGAFASAKGGNIKLNATCIDTTLAWGECAQAYLFGTMTYHLPHGKPNYVGWGATTHK